MLYDIIAPSKEHLLGKFISYTVVWQSEQERENIVLQ